ncbi:MAG TPA: serine hydrolase [Bryobacteraceae bacterium]|nr:serine hydrolase [Bryobacteraceae bacterium]
MKRRLAVFLMFGPMLLGADANEIRAMLENRIDVGKKAVGIVVGTIDEKGRSVIGYGRLAKDRDQKPDGDTVFEIGSITKVFTSLILADMVERGEVKLDDPIAKYLPASVTVPSRNGKQITLLDISMQISGLPRMPNNFKPADFANPYADYSEAKLYEFISGYKLTRDIGEKYEYSNLAVGLLGHALALKAGMSYEKLVKTRILDPLGMSDTSITLSESQKKRLATGHNEALSPVKNWDLDALEGAGALRSTANDMLKFLAANLELTDSPLKPAMRRMRSVHRETGVPDLEIGMAWHVWHKFGSNIFWHNGGTAGYRSYAGFDPAKKTGVVVLCNSFFDIDQVGLHVLNKEFTAQTYAAPKERVEVTLDPKILETYVGEYELAPTFKIKITREESRLFAQATGQPKFEVFAEKEGEFFFKVVDAQLTFTKEGLILHQNGMDQKAPKK